MSWSCKEDVKKTGIKLESREALDKNQLFDICMYETIEEKEISQWQLKKRSMSTEGIKLTMEDVR